MTTLTIAFHQSVALPDSARGLIGASIPVDPSWSVRDLSSKIERQCADSGVGVRVCALINPLRGAAAAPHDLATSHFANGDKVVLLADVLPQVFPSTEAKPRCPADPVPVTIFTGFLGAGKTTVLNHLLMGQRDKKFAVIENEFGEVPIDNELLQNSALGMAEQVVVMENGCMCCTVRGDLLGAFDQIRKQMEKGSPLDAVLVETTGMADPVPIVRTLRQTPDIAKYFKLDGTITLVDTKTILNRLAECAGGKDDQERHRQIAFADRILLNKLDLVDDNQCAEVWQRIRSFNASAKIIPSVKGIVPASELTNLGAFDVNQIAEEQAEHGGGHGEGHGGGHGGGHESSDDCGDEHGHGGHGGDGHGQGHDAGHGHDASRHDAGIGSFSIVRPGMEIEPLSFQRWRLVMATLPEEQGILYRSKGVLAAAGRPAKFIWHAVADVTETSDGPLWKEDEKRQCKIVFIGKKLDKATIQARFLTLLQPVWKRMRSLTAPSAASSCGRTTFMSLIENGMAHHALLGCWSKDVLRMSQCSAMCRDKLLGPEGLGFFQRAASLLSAGAPKGLHTVEGAVWLHGIMPMCSIKKYTHAFRQAKVKISTPCSGDYMWGKPMEFNSLADAEAFGVICLELCEMSDTDTTNFLVEFSWRPETMKSFFDVAGSATNSALVKITVEDPSGDSELDDDLKFRVNLNPETDEDKAGMMLHRMSLQLVGGKSSSHVYQIFFHTVDSTYQVHINVPDHRQPIFPTKEVFHQWHPLMNGLKERPRLRFLLRLKSMESGPLDAMCGCCG